MNYLATFAFSMLSIRWPLVGIISFLLSYTGMAGFFEELHILGTALGAVRPDNIALAVSVIVLLQRPSTIKIPYNIKFLMYIITAIVPVGMFFSSSSMYMFLATCWRIFFWAPLFFALTRLSEKEWEVLRDAFIVLLAINGLLTYRIIHNNDYALYRRLGNVRLLSFDADNTVAAMAFKPIEALRLVLPGTFDFGSIAVLLSFTRILSSRFSVRRRLLYIILLLCILYAIYFTLSRTSAASVILGSAVMVLFLLPGTRFRETIYAFLLIAVACVGTLIILQHYSVVSNLWDGRITGSSDDYYSGHMRIENNLTYLNILAHSYAIIGHPGFERAAAIAGRQNDVIAPIAMWWSYGLVAAVCYCIIFIYFAWCMFKLLGTAMQPEQRIALSTSTGMFVAYVIDHLSGADPLNFQFPFILSFVLSSCACMLFPKVQAQRHRVSQFFRMREISVH